MQTCRVCLSLAFRHFRERNDTERQPELGLSFEICGVTGAEHKAGLIAAAPQIDIELEISNRDVMLAWIELANDKAFRLTGTHSLAIDHIIGLNSKPERRRPVDNEP